MKLRNIRKLNGLSQSEMAKLFNLTQGTYSNYENGTTQPDIKLLIKIADYYNITLDYLVDREFKPESVFLNETEKELIETYRKMNNTSKKISIAVLQAILSAQN